MAVSQSVSTLAEAGGGALVHRGLRASPAERPFQRRRRLSSGEVNRSVRAAPETKKREKDDERHGPHSARGGGAARQCGDEQARDERVGKHLHRRIPEKADGFDGHGDPEPEVGFEALHQEAQCEAQAQRHHRQHRACGGRVNLEPQPCRSLPRHVDVGFGVHRTRASNQWSGATSLTDIPQRRDRGNGRSPRRTQPRMLPQPALTARGLALDTPPRAVRESMDSLASVTPMGLPSVASAQHLQARWACHAHFGNPALDGCREHQQDNMSAGATCVRYPRPAKEDSVAKRAFFLFEDGGEGDRPQRGWRCDVVRFPRDGRREKKPPRPRD